MKTTTMLMLLLAARAPVAFPVKGVAKLSTIRREGDKIMFVYDDGSEDCLPTGYGDHGLTMLVCATTGQTLAFAQLTSDAAWDLRLPVNDPTTMRKRGLIAVTNVDNLGADELARLARPVHADILHDSRRAA